MLIFAANLLVVLAFSVLFLLVGSLLSAQVGFDAALKAQRYLRLGIAYFSGLLVFLTAWVLLARPFGAGAALLIVVAVSVAALFVRSGHCLTWLREFRRELPVWIICTLLLIALGTLKSLAPLTADFVLNPATANPFAGFGGAVHSFRAGNVSLFILVADWIPVLNQNIGQSLLAAVPLFFGIMSPQAALVLWLNSILAAAIFFSWGLLEWLVQERKTRLIGVAFLVMGAAALSLSYASITDTESTLLLSSNADSVVSVFSFVVFLLFVFRLSDDFQPTHLTAWQVALLALLGFAWNLVGAQNILLAGLVLFTLVVVNRKMPARLRVLVVTGLLVLAGGIGGIFFGGFLSPQAMRETAAIPGVMSVAKAGEAAVSLRPFRLSEGNSDSFRQALHLFRGERGPVPTGTVAQAAPAASVVSEPKTWREKIKASPLTFTLARIFRSIQLVVFPVLGLAALFYALRGMTGRDEPERFKRFLLRAAVTLFAFGVFASSSFKLYGYYWELSRFLYIGNYLAMLCGALALPSLAVGLWRSRRRFASAALTALLVVSIFGPATQYFVVSIIGNFMPTKDGSGATRVLSVKERWEELNGLKAIIGAQIKE